MWQEFKSLKAEKANLKQFAFTVGIAFLGLSLIFFMRAKFTNGLISAIFGVLLLLLRELAPPLLFPIYKLWMSMSLVLGWISTRVILTFLFVLVFIPISLILKLIGKDLLFVNTKKTSYWIKKDVKDMTLDDYRKQY